jgi:DMSO/TMAO reductase YedYZ molybdopterin-dependent catalytic subunit
MNKAVNTARWNLLKIAFVGFLAGIPAGLLMLVCALLLRWLFGLPTPSELFFDRTFPLVSIDFFIRAIGWAGGYTPLKISGIIGAFAGQILVAAIGGAIYAIYLELKDRKGASRARRSIVDTRGWKLLLPLLLIVWIGFEIFFWPTLLTNYRGVPPEYAIVLSSLTLLVDFGVCALGIMVFCGLLISGDRTPLLRSETDSKALADGRPRRAFLLLGMTALLGIAFSGVLKRLYNVATFFYDGKTYDGPKVAKITPTVDFYSVTKNIVDPDVVRRLWRLEVAGLVEQPKTYRFEEIEAMQFVDQETTLMCISNPIGGGLISNAIWRGVPLPNVLGLSKPKPGVAALLFHAADGYYETIPYAKAMEPTTMLAYGMNGGPLPRIHGFPLRMIVPGLYGEKNPKWLTRIDLLAEGDPRLVRRRGCGFYKEQGWGPNFQIPTFSRIDSPEIKNGRMTQPLKAGQPVQLRGVAFGGDRGISNVELSLDHEKSWQEAKLLMPGTKISWSIWGLSWAPSEPGDYVISVRATDGNGKLQITEERGTVPQGATGIQRVAAKVVA